MEPKPFDDQAPNRPEQAWNPLDPDADPFRPPTLPTEVQCLHCGCDYESYLMEWRVESGHTGQAFGRWCCPTPGCDGAGFGFDVFPTDPDYVGEDGQPMFCWDEVLDEDEVEDELDELFSYDEDCDCPTCQQAQEPDPLLNPPKGEDVPDLSSDFPPDFPPDLPPDPADFWPTDTLPPRRLPWNEPGRNN